MVTATFCQALSGQAPAIDITGVLILWRFIVSTLTLLHFLFKSEVPRRWVLVSGVTTPSAPSYHPNLQPPRSVVAS